MNFRAITMEKKKKEKKKKKKRAIVAQAACSLHILTSSDGEVERGHGDNLVVVMGAAAVALAYGDLELVRARGPGVVLIGLGVQREGARVSANLRVHEEAAALSGGARAEDDNANGADAGPGGELVADGEVKLGANVASGGLDREVGNVSSVVVVVVASLELLAQPNRVGISADSEMRKTKDSG